MLAIELFIMGTAPELERIVCYSFLGITISSWCAHMWKLIFDGVFKSVD